MSSALEKFSPQYPVPLAEQITEFLCDSIIEGRIGEGQRLVENELQRELGVSRAPIREAFRELEKKSLVIIVPRKGTFVRTIDRKDIEENFIVRAPLEGLAAKLATAHMGQKDIRVMESTFSKMQKAVMEKDFGSYLKYHSDYHNTFINGCNNDTLIGILEGLRIQAIWYRFLYDYAQETYEYGMRSHREILDLLIEKDADRLEVVVKQHLLRVLDWFLKYSPPKKGDKP
jgi:DNA-binding GntR family transcriptional regulator